jgi:hypothetical protein
VEPPSVCPCLLDVTRKRPLALSRPGLVLGVCSVVVAALGSGDAVGFGGHRGLHPWYAVFVPRTFVRTARWHQVATSFHDRVLGGSLFPPTLASTTRLAQPDVMAARRGGISRSTVPLATLRALPTDGIVISVSASARALPSPRITGIYPTRSPQIRLASATVRRGRREGLRDPTSSIYLFQARVRGRYLAPWLRHQYVSIRIWFGSRDLTTTTLDSAQAELNRLVIIHC